MCVCLHRPEYFQQVLYFAALWIGILLVHSTFFYHSADFNLLCLLCSGRPVHHKSVHFVYGFKVKISCIKLSHQRQHYRSQNDWLNINFSLTAMVLSSKPVKTLVTNPLYNTKPLRMRIQFASSDRAASQAREWLANSGHIMWEIQSMDAIDLKNYKKFHLLFAISDCVLKSKIKILSR